MARMFIWAPVSLCLFLSLSARAEESQSEATTADVRCIIVASIMGNQEANAHSAALLALYFMGRIDGREPPSFDLSKAIMDEIKAMAPADFNSEGKRCGKVLEGRGTYLAEVGHKLTQLG